MIFVNILISILILGSFSFYTFIYPKKKVNLFALLLIISILPVISIFRIGTYESGDLTLHSVFLQSFFENLKDGIYIPQWAGGLCGGYGCPVFMFEYIIPFYMGSFFHILRFTYLDSIKLLLAFSFILSGTSMYIFLKDELNKKSCLVGTLLYLFAPIRFIEMHFRVSIGTDVAFIFIPLVFLFAKKSLEGKLIFIILGAINFFLLALSHSSVAFVIIPACFLFILIRKKSLKELIYPIFSFLLGMGILAFYALPAITEVGYTWYSQTMKTVTEFYPISYYIFSPARFGLLFQGNNGELRLIVGYAQLFIVFISLYMLYKNKFGKFEKRIIIFLLLFFSTCFLLMLSFTKIIWDNIFFMRSFQFPWRMLSPIAFITAYLGAIVTKNWNKTIITFFCVFIIYSTFLNWGNRKMTSLDPNAYNNHWSLYTEYFEPNNYLYLSRYKNRAPNIPNIVLNHPISHLEIFSGVGNIKEIKHTQINHAYIIHAKTNLVIFENTFYFPGWKVFSNRKEIPINYENMQNFGIITFKLEKGIYLIDQRFVDTTIERIGKYISSASILLIFFLLSFKILRIFKPKS